MATFRTSAYFKRHFRFSWQQKDAQKRQSIWSCRKMAEVEETLKRIEAHRGVIGTIVVNAEGIPIRSTLDNSITVQYAGLLRQLAVMARSTVRDIDPQNDLTFLRIRTKKHEIMIGLDNDFLLIVIQKPCE
ncbi:hypothetical protein INR49_021580 [Caranx melampygus]|nr:hypothetical protein INR49_021580 [Caranx melampygus]